MVRGISRRSRDGSRAKPTEQLRRRQLRRHRPARGRPARAVDDLKGDAWRTERLAPGVYRLCS